MHVVAHPVTLPVSATPEAVMQKISVIIPALNEAEAIGVTLASLASLRKAGGEIIVVDGGSTDATRDIARPLCDLLVESTKGRARQMNAGAARARGELLWFLHADSPPSPAVLDELACVAESDALWGRFDVRLSGTGALIRATQWLMNRRSHLSGICTGDQGIFVRRQLFEDLDGYADIALMEDIELSRRLRRHAWPTRLRGPLLTSSRRWEQNGVIHTIVTMWRLRLAFFLGADPDVLARQYRDNP